MANSTGTPALEVLNRACKFLEDFSVDSPRRSAEVLLSELLGVRAHEIYLDRDLALGNALIGRYLTMVERRQEGEPLEYIVGNVEFMGLRLDVERGVFIPRPETEVLSETVLEHMAGTTSPVVADICSGCGAIALALASLRADLFSYGTDISDDAVRCAERNAEKLGMSDRVTFLVGNLAEPLESLELEGRLDCVVSNPPYVAEDEMTRLPAGVRAYEPGSALSGGRDGTVFYSPIIEGAVRLLKPGGLIALEIGEGSEEKVKAQLSARGFTSIESREDLRGVTRFITGSRRECPET